MNELKICGAPSLEEIQEVGMLHDKEQARKPLAFIECIEEIPCNPCEAACPFQAITVGEPIIHLPKLDVEKCTGCGQCIAACPGLCITVRQYGDEWSRMSFPYEYLPVPSKGDTVDLVDRLGEVVCQGTIIRVLDQKKNHHTKVVTVEYPSAYFHDVISIGVLSD